MNGAAAYLIFSIRPGAVPGDSAVTLTIPEDGLTDRLGNGVPAVTNGNTVTVIDYLIGGEDSDGEVTPLDRMILARFLVRWIGYEALPFGAAPVPGSAE